MSKWIRLNTDTLLNLDHVVTVRAGRDREGTFYITYTCSFSVNERRETDARGLSVQVKTYREHKEYFHSEDEALARFREVEALLMGDSTPRKIVRSSKS